MTSAADKLLQEAMTLPEQERAAIAARLIASLDAGEPEEPGNVEEAWAAEIERRCNALDAGTAVTRSWEDVRRRVRTELLRK